MQSSRDVLSALQSVQRSTNAFSGLYDFRLEVKNGEAAYHCEPVQVWNDLSPETARHSVDYAFSGLITILHLLTGRRIRPLRASYRYLRPADLSEHERVLGCRPSFDQGANRIVFSSKDLDHPVVGYNSQLNALLQDLLEAEMRKRIVGGTFQEKVKEMVLRNMQVTFPPLEAIADLLHMTPRAIQRRLQEEGTTFRSVSDALKEEIARNLLANPELSIVEIALKLGYGEVSSFHRAFKQWVGMTPVEFRRKSN